jgi:hypothetical protein
LILFVLYGAAFDALSHGVLRYAESGRGLRYRKTLYCQVLYPSTRVRPPDRLSKQRDRAGRARAALRIERARAPSSFSGTLDRPADRAPDKFSFWDLQQTIREREVFMEGMSEERAKLSISLPRLCDGWGENPAGNLTKRVIREDAPASEPRNLRESRASPNKGRIFEERNCLVGYDEALTNKGRR